MSKYSPPPLPLLTGLFNEHLITSKNPLICEVRWGIRTAMDFSWCISLCAEWEAEKGGRMGCLMKEKIQGMAERKAFILLFLIVWALEFLSHQIIKFMKSYLFPPNGWRSAPAGCGSEYSREVGEKGGREGNLQTIAVCRLTRKADPAIISLP